MPSASAAACALAASREAMATTSEWAERWMAGVTCSMPILAVDKMPQRIFSTIMSSFACWFGDESSGARRQRAAGNGFGVDCIDDAHIADGVRAAGRKGRAALDGVDEGRELVIIGG